MTLFLLNIAVTIIFIWAYLPQFKTTFTTKSADGVAIQFWYFISLSTAISLFNLLLTGDAAWYVYLGQFINALAAYILLIMVSSKKEGWVRTTLTTVLYTIAVVLFFMAAPLAVTQTVATIAVILAYVFQIHHFVKHKTAEGTNPKLYYYFSIGLTFLVTIMFMTNVSLHVIATELVNIALLVICGILSSTLNKRSKTI